MDDKVFQGEWEGITAVNDADGPSPRCGHTLTIHGNHGTGNKNSSTLTKLLVAFGESSLLSDREYYDDMYIFDVECRQWTQIAGSQKSNYFNAIEIAQSKSLKFFENVKKMNEIMDNSNDIIQFEKSKILRYLNINGSNNIIGHKSFNESENDSKHYRNNYKTIPRADHAACSFGHNNDRGLIFGGKFRDAYLEDLILIRNIASFKSPNINSSNSNSNRIFDENCDQVLFNGHPIDYSFDDYGNDHTRYDNLSHFIKMWDQTQEEEEQEQESKRKKKVTICDTRRQVSVSKKNKGKTKSIRIEPLHLAKGPCGRRGSSLTYWKEGSFLLFGGQRGALFLNDLWGLDLHKQGWVELPTQSNPCKRAFHSAFVDDEQKLLILGGVKDTQANPVTPDIYKLDLREGKFNKLGDKDMVPGLENALIKGHHSSHFLSKQSDLIIYAPQNATGYVLGGNSSSKHCGRCVAIENGNNSNNNNNNINNTNNNNSSRNSKNSKKKNNGDLGSMPRGTCRPATAVLAASQSPANLISRGWNDKIMDRLFVFGGFVPSKNECSKHLISLKFSTDPCTKNDLKHKKPTTTPAVGEAQRERERDRRLNSFSKFGSFGSFDSFECKSESPLNRGNYNENENRKNNNSDDSDLNNLNITPMRHGGSLSKTMAFTPMMDGGRLKGNRNVTSNGSFSTGGTSRKRMSVNRMTDRDKNKNVEKEYNRRVILSRTPVRSHCSPRITLKSLESEVSQQKIRNLDPALLQPCKNSDNCEVFDKKSLHWRVIESIIISPNENILDKSEAFMLSPSDIYYLCEKAYSLFLQESTLINIEPPVKVFGDIHGQLGDLLALFKAFGSPDHILGDINMYKYVFLGDFVDRGHKSLEVICLLLALKIAYPRKVFLIRGNHECNAMNELYGFHAEIKERTLCDANDICINNNGNMNRIDCDDDDVDDVDDDCDCRSSCDQECTTDEETDGEIEKDSNNYFIDNENGNKFFRKNGKIIFSNYKSMEDTLKECFNKIFCMLPLSGLIGERILCVHGGIGELSKISDISSLTRPCDVVCDASQEMSENEKAVVDILWSDPAETDDFEGFDENKRGVSCVFGSDIVRKFCKENDIDLIIRAHQVVKDGYEYFAGGHLITVFSATNYCDVMENAGAILCIDHNLRVVPKLVEPRIDRIDMIDTISNFSNAIPNEIGNGNEIGGIDKENNNDRNNNFRRIEKQWRDVGQAPSPMRGTQSYSFTGAHHGAQRSAQRDPNSNTPIFNTVRHPSEFDIETDR